MACRPSTVLHQESEESWQDRAFDLNEAGESFDNLELVLALYIYPSAVLELMQTTDATVVIIDTERDVLRPEDENDNAKVAKCLRPNISAARRKGQTLILLHHESKKGGRDTRGVSSGHALVGSADIFL